MINIEPLKIAHIVHPVIVDQFSDLNIAQPVTFETMHIAREYAKGAVNVNLYAIQYHDEEHIPLPKSFIRTRSLQRSVGDVAIFPKKRKLAIIKDILDILYEFSSADYFIYTNVDIALMPQFYIVIEKIIEQGFDAFVINRRTITKNYTDIKDIPLMYCDVGKTHPGFDCFVFKKEIYNKFYLNTACIGTNWIGRVLITNLIANATNFKIFDDLHLTFHIGDDRSWKQSDYYEYARHNENELYKTLIYFKRNNNVFHPMLEGFIKQVENINKKIPFYNEVSISQNPIFVVGFTRSGTTLLQSLIATQENIYTFPETHFFCEYLNQYLQLKDGIISKECLDDFFKKAREFSGLDIDWYEIDYFKMLADKGMLTDKMFFENIVKHHLIKQVDYKEISGITWLEKTPYHGFVMEKILQMYPESRFVSIIRHPLPTIYSTKKYIHPNETYEFIANKWKRLVNQIEEFKIQHPEKIYSVKHEDLIREPNNVIKEVCRFLMVGFNEDKLGSFSEIAQKAVKPFEQWKEPVLQKSISSKDNSNFLNNMPLKDVLILQNLLKEEISRYGFSLHNKAQQTLFNEILER